jgi:hypothetical protein
LAESSQFGATRRINSTQDVRADANLRERSRITVDIEVVARATGRSRPARIGIDAFAGWKL